MYKATYKTQRGSLRSYIGYTGNVDVRRWWHSKKPPAWMKPEEGEAVKFEVLEADIKSKPVALAAEALHAARAIDQAPKLVRGGPWVKPTLAEGWEEEVQAVARMRSYMVMKEFAQTRPCGNLSQHLHGLTFTAASDAAEGEDVCRGAHIRVYRKSSGVSGNKSRKSQLKRGVLKRPSAYHVRVHRGIDARAARRRETANRRSR